MRRWRRTMPSAWSRPRAGEADVLVLAARDVAVALEPADHLVHRRRRELHRAGDVRARSSAAWPPAARTGSGGTPPRRLWRARWPSAHAILPAAERAPKGRPAHPPLQSRGDADRIWHARARHRRFARNRPCRRPRARRSAARPSGSPHARRATSRRSPRELPGAHQPLTCDVALPASIATAIEEFVAATGGLDLLVANAGIAHYEPIVDAEPRAHRADDRGQLAGHGLHRQGRAALPARRRRRAHRRDVLGRGAARLSRRRRLQRDEGRPADVRRGPAPRAGRHRRLGDDGLPRRDPAPRCTTTSSRGCPRGTAAGRTPPSPRRSPGGSSRPSSATAAHLHYRPLVKGMGILHGVSPGMADRVLRRLRGGTAAPAATQRARRRRRCSVQRARSRAPAPLRRAAARRLGAQHLGERVEAPLGERHERLASPATAARRGAR